MVIPGDGRAWPAMNAETHTWKACWGQPLASSNLASSATSDQAMNKPRSCAWTALAGLRSLILSTYIGLKHPINQAHASDCYRGLAADHSLKPRYRAR